MYLHLCMKLGAETITLSLKTPANKLFESTLFQGARYPNYHVKNKQLGIWANDHELL